MTILSYQTRDERDTRFDWATLVGKLGPLIGLAFVISLFSILAHRSFPTIANAELILRQTAVVGTAALGMTLIIIAGGIDLSVGSAIALVTVVIARLLSGFTLFGFTVPPQPPVCAVVGGIAVGGLCGMMIGTMVVGRVARVFAVLLGFIATAWLYQLGAHIVISLLAGLAACAVALVLDSRFLRRIELAPFIVTLGTWGALRGAAKSLADNSMVYPPSTWLNALLKPISETYIALLTPGAWLMLFLAVLVALMLRFTRFGRHIFAVGSNEQTARLCGIPVERTKLIIYTLGAMFAGIAGLLQFSYLTMGDPTTANGMELDIIAAVVIGGASLSGGQGSILGSLMGALIMTVVGNGCTKLELSNSVQQMVTGGIIIFAVSLDRLRQRKL